MYIYIYIYFNFNQSVHHEVLLPDGICRDKSPKLCVGPWALAEDVGWSENK